MFRIIAEQCIESVTNVACIQLAILRGEQREDHASRSKFTADVDLHKLLCYIIARDPGKKTLLHDNPFPSDFSSDLIPSLQHFPKRLSRHWFSSV